MRSVDFGVRAVITAFAVGISAIAAQPAMAAVTGVFIDDIFVDDATSEVSVAFAWSFDHEDPFEFPEGGYEAQILILLPGETLQQTFRYETLPDAGFLPEEFGGPAYSAFETVSYSMAGTPLPQPGCYDLTVIVTEVTSGSSAEATVEAGVCIGDPSTEDPLPVPVDIKPGSCPNPITIRQRGVIPVAIAGTDDLDVLDIDPDSVRLMGVKPIRWNYEDVATPYFPNIDKPDCLDCTTQRGDGHLDLTLKFDAQELVDAIRWCYGDENRDLIDRECLILFLDGELWNGTSIAGEDVVRIQGGGRGGNSGKNASKKDKSDKKKDKADKDKSKKDKSGKGKSGKGKSKKGE